MGSIPGDADYGGEVIRRQLEELAGRIEGASDDLLPLVKNIHLISEIADIAGVLESDEVKTGYQAVIERAAGLLDRATLILDELMTRAGVELGDTPTQTSVQTGIVSKNTEKDLGTLLLPPQLRGVTDGGVQRVLGEMVFGLQAEEIEANIEKIQRAQSVVSVSEHGDKLSVVRGTGITHFTNNLPAAVVRGVNIYTRTLAAGLLAFKRSDVAMLCSPGGGANMMEITGQTDGDLRARLRIPQLFTSNGQQRGAARYSPTGNVVFIAAEALTDDIVDSAP